MIYSSSSCSGCLGVLSNNLIELYFPFKHQKKFGLVVSKLDSQFEGHGFKSHQILDGNGVKAMPGYTQSWII